MDKKTKIVKPDSEGEAKAEDDIISMAGVEELVKLKNQKEKLGLRKATITKELQELEVKRMYALPKDVLQFDKRKLALEMELQELNNTLELSDISMGR